MNKIVALNLNYQRNKFLSIKALLVLLLNGAFLLSSGCLMTRHEGDDLGLRVNKMEGEVAKLKRVRQDLEILLSGRVGDLYERLARIESTLESVQESIFAGSLEKDKLVLELQSIKDQLEHAKIQSTVPQIPSKKEDHFAQAKKLYLAGDFVDATYLFNELIKKHPKDKVLTGQAYYILGEIYNKQSETTQGDSEKLLLNKKAIVNWQKVIELGSPQNAKEEAFYKMGVLLKSMGNKTAAAAAFNALLEDNRQSIRASEAKKHLASLENDQ